MFNQTFFAFAKSVRFALSDPNNEHVNIVKNRATVCFIVTNL
jgi:hypothetical protein